MDCEKFMAEVEASLSQRQRPQAGEKIRVGLDLGTASIVLVVLAEDGRPLGAARRFAQVVRDGLVVDFSAARNISAELRQELQEALGQELNQAAIAVPPGTSERDAASHGYVASGAGLEVTRILDEPTAANLVLGLSHGAIVDIGGGTTGVALLKDGQVIKTFDEPTGGVHLTLVLAGHHKMDFEQAELFKQNPQNSRQIAALVAPVLEKMGSIIRQGLEGFQVDEIRLVGGTASTADAAKIIARETGLRTSVAPCPILVTPAGIALSCPAYQGEPYVN